MVEAIREFSGEEVVEGGGEAPDIGDGFDVFEVHDLLGGHEDRGAGVLAGEAHAAEAGDLEVLGEAEVGHLRPALVDEDVVRFEVAVDEAFLVGGGESFERLECPRAEGIPWQGAAVAAGDIGERAAIAVFHDEEEGAFVRAAVEEADDIGMPELGDDVHLALELGYGTGVGLGAGEHDFHGHFFGTVLLGLCQIDRTAAAAAEFALDVVAFKKERIFAGFAEDQLLHGLRRESGKIALRQGGVHLPDTGSVRRSLDTDLDTGLADGDAVAVLEGYAGILARSSLFRGFAFFATAAFFPVDVGAVHAAEIAQGGLGWAGFE